MNLERKWNGIEFSSGCESEHNNEYLLYDTPAKEQNGAMNQFTPSPVLEKSQTSNFLEIHGFHFVNIIN